jgi:hypothetical protein
LQKPEQHSVLAAQLLPAVLHSGFSAAHEPLLQTPEQHSPSLSHDAASLVHCVLEHLKSTHENEQQSGPDPQGSSAMRHSPATRAQSPVVVSQ